VKPAATAPADYVPELKLRIKALPVSLNVWSRDWKVRHRQQQEWKLRFYNAFGMDRRQKVYLHGPWFPGAVNIGVTFHVAGKRRMDLDNLVPKCLIDAMRGEVFRDDNIEVVRMLVLESRRTTEHLSWTEVLVVDARE
jgi:Holliday junction resolvase RusA-like endonuclease